MKTELPISNRALHGITLRDNAIAAHKQKPLGNLTSALDLKQSK